MERSLRAHASAPHSWNPVKSCESAQWKWFWIQQWPPFRSQISRRQRPSTNRRHRRGRFPALIIRQRLPDFIARNAKRIFATTACVPSSCWEAMFTSSARSAAPIASRLCMNTKPGGAHCLKWCRAPSTSPAKEKLKRWTELRATMSLLPICVIVAIGLKLNR